MIAINGHQSLFLLIPELRATEGKVQINPSVINCLQKVAFI